MAPLAILTASRGAVVSGSDRNHDRGLSLPVFDALRAAGVRVTTSEEAGAEACCGTGMVHALDGVASDTATRSGWMYSVNGRAPSVGPAATVVREGDVVEWIYR